MPIDDTTDGISETSSYYVFRREQIVSAYSLNVALLWQVELCS